MTGDCGEQFRQPTTARRAFKSASGAGRTTWRRAAATVALLLFGIWTYLVFFVLTDLESSISTLALLLSVLIGSVASRRRVKQAAGFRLAAAGATTLQGWSVVRDFAVSDRWSTSELRAATYISIGPRLVALGCILLGVIIFFKSSQRTDQRPKAVSVPGYVGRLDDLA